MVDLARLQPGQSLVYFTGESLANARDIAPVEAADAAWQMALSGEVWLVQRRRPDGGLDYTAIKRRSIDRCPVKPIMSEAPSFRRKAA